LNVGEIAIVKVFVENTSGGDRPYAIKSPSGGTYIICDFSNITIQTSSSTMVTSERTVYTEQFINERFIMMRTK
jgi:hypothetical protein